MTQFPTQPSCDPGRVIDRFRTPVCVGGLVLGLGLLVGGVLVDPDAVDLGRILLYGGAAVLLIAFGGPTAASISGGLPFVQVTRDGGGGERRVAEARLHLALVVECAEGLIPDPSKRSNAVERTVQTASEWNGRGSGSLLRYLLCQMIGISREIESKTVRLYVPSEPDMTVLAAADREIITLADTARLPAECVGHILGMSVPGVHIAYTAAHGHLEELRRP